MEKRRSSLRMNLFQAQDEVDGRKESLIAEIEVRLSQRVEEKKMFLIQWKII